MFILLDDKAIKQGGEPTVIFILLELVTDGIWKLVETKWMDEDTGSEITGGCSRGTLGVEREKALRT